VILVAFALFERHQRQVHELVERLRPWGS
jgi:hypothetical protein